jgi:hypothetical protein
MTKGRALNWTELEALIVPMLREGKHARQICVACGIPLGTLYPRLARLRARYNIPPPKSVPPGRKPARRAIEQVPLSERQAYGVDPLPPNCDLARRILDGAP